MCIHTHTHIIYNIETLVGQTKQKKIGTTVNAACHFGQACHVFVSPAVGFLSVPTQNNLKVLRLLLNIILQLNKTTTNSRTYVYMKFFLVSVWGVSSEVCHRIFDTLCIVHGAEPGAPRCEAAL